MSKIRSPQDKKALSLKRDRRNTYGENPAASRKGIRKGKQRSHMHDRRSVAQILGGLRANAGESASVEADVSSTEKIAENRQKAFRKMPDSPLSVAIKKKQQKRASLANSGIANVQRPFLDFRAKGTFDMAYNAAAHKRLILIDARFLESYFGVRRRTKKHQRNIPREVEEALLWKNATLRDAPLLKGFFADEPAWRGKILSWCEKILHANAVPGSSR